ncbi:MAG TPA: formyltransferase family protein, partial [Ktedonobacterales bacterium]|nr:formyltransferase family protein [Ktedonobacterales bacterium]
MRDLPGITRPQQTTSQAPAAEAQSNDTPTLRRPLRALYFGMASSFSRPPLAALLQSGVDVRAIVIPGLPGASLYGDREAPAQANDPQPYTLLPMGQGMGGLAASRRKLVALPLLTTPTTTTGTIIESAARHGIPVYEITRLDDPRTLALLASFAPDVICVACFSRRVPLAVLRLPHLSCLNVHPSLLPDNRGPDPLFWTFQRGEAITGVTIHQMDEGFDSGAIVLQQAVNIPVGMTEESLETQLATLGGELLVQAVSGLATGALHPIPQDRARATVYPWPNNDDYVIDLRQGAWSANRAYRFACGVGG